MISSAGLPAWLISTTCSSVGGGRCCMPAQPASGARHRRVATFLEIRPDPRSIVKIIGSSWLIDPPGRRQVQSLIDVEWLSAAAVNLEAIPGQEGPYEIPHHRIRQEPLT